MKERENTVIMVIINRLDGDRSVLKETDRQML